MQRPSPFIIPAHPVLRDRPPKGDGWLHEVKFDGYRAQLHKAGKAAAIYSKNGRDFSNRFPGILHALLALPCKNAIIDAENRGVEGRRLRRLPGPVLGQLHAGPSQETRIEMVCGTIVDLNKLAHLGHY